MKKTKANKRKKNLRKNTINISIKIMLFFLTTSTIINLLINQSSFALAATNATKDEISFMISKLEKNITNLKEQGFNTVRIDDNLAEIISYYTNGKYDEAKTAYDKSTALVSKIIHLSKLMNSTSLLIDEAEKRGFDATQASQEYTAGIGEFKSNNFESSQISLEKSQSLTIAFLKNESGKIVNELKEINSVLIEKEINIATLNKTINNLMMAEKNNDLIALFEIAKNIGLLNQSLNRIHNLTEESKIIEEKGFKTTRVKEAISEITYLLEIEDYNSAEKKYNETITIIRKITYLNDEIKKMNEKILSPELAGIDLTKEKEMINISLNEFQIENYERAESYLENAKESIEETEQAHIFTTIMNKARAKFDIMSFLKKNWLKTIITITIILIIIKSTIFIVKLKLGEKKLENLKKEQEAITELTKTLQRDYFKHGIVDKDTYLAETSNYDKRSSKISGEIPELEKNLKQKREKLSNIKEKTMNKINSTKKKWMSKKKVNKKN